MERKETQIDSGGTRATYRHGNLRESALAEAHRSLMDNGELGSLRSMAKVLGVNHAALYRHFADKDALLIALAADGFANLAANLQEASNLAGVVERYIAFAVHKSGLYEVMMSRQNDAFGPDGSLRQSLQVILSAIRCVLGEHTTDFEIKKLWVLLHGAISLQASGALMPRDEKALSGFVIAMLDKHLAK